MTDQQCAEIVNRGHFLYWDMLGKLGGVLEARPGAVGAYRRVGYRAVCRGIELELI